MIRNITIVLAVKLLIIASVTYGQDVYIPEDLKVFYEQEKIESSFEINTVMNPFYLRGDFDGDKKIDYAIAVTERKTGKGGILFYHPSLKNYFVVGAGVEISNRPSDDYGWMNAWEIFCKKEIEKGVGETGTIKLKGDAILVLKLESSSGLIYWNGKEYQWYQQGD